MNLTSGEKYLVDTNVLVYSVDQSSSFYKKAREILERGLRGEFTLVIAHQNLIEFVAVLTRGYGVKIKNALDDAAAFVSHFEVIFPLPTTIDVFFQLARVHKRIYAFDLYLAATMLDNKIMRIITGNAKDFAGLSFKEVIEIQ